MKHWIALIIILLFSLIGLKALIPDHLYTAHDIWHNMARLYYYTQAFKEGIFPPYWIGNMANGYGYPLFFFSFHLPWIIALPLVVFGLKLETIFRILMFVSYFFSGVTMYIFSFYLLKNKLASLVSALLYLWVPFHFLTIFVSASIGVAYVFTFLPLLLLGIFFLINDPSPRKGVIIVSISLTAIILSHLIMSFLSLPVIGIFYLWCLLTNRSLENQKSLKEISIRTIWAIGLTFLISSFYLIPAQYYSQYTLIGNEHGFARIYTHYFVDIKQLIYSKWGYAPIINDARDEEISLQVGIAQWLGLLIGIFFLLKKKLNQYFKSLIISLTLAFLVNIFLMLHASIPVWKLISGFFVPDFPFRFLLPTVLVSSLLAGIVVSLSNKKFQLLLAIIFIGVALYSNRHHTQVNLYYDRSVENILTTETSTNNDSEYRPEGANPKYFVEHGPRVIPTNLDITNFSQNTKQLSFEVNASESAQISVGQFAFPGNNLYIDGRKHSQLRDPERRVSFILPKGVHTVQVIFEDTQIIKISKLLTLLGLIIIFIMTIKPRIFHEKS